MASATRGDAPGYDDDKEFGNNIAHLLAQASKGCANIATRPRMSRQGRIPRDFREISGLQAVRRVRKCCNRAKARHGRSLTASWPGKSAKRVFARRPGHLL